MARFEWTEVDPESLGPPLEVCQCPSPWTDCTLNFEDSSLTIWHKECDKQIDIEDPLTCVTIEDMPVSVEFVDLGMTTAGPWGPAEWDGFYFEVKPRRER